MIVFTQSRSIIQSTGDGSLLKSIEVTYVKKFNEFYLSPCWNCINSTAIIGFLYIIYTRALSNFAGKIAIFKLKI